jgi:Dolichyl-phosphate-mannose-protein mannosyltransferase
VQSKPPRQTRPEMRTQDGVRALSGRPAWQRLAAVTAVRPLASPLASLRVGVLVVAAGYVAAFLIAAAFRLTYPYPLEITESASIVQVQRLLRGEPLYLAPTLQHVPLIYGPVYFYISAFFAGLLHLSYLPLRLVSLLAAIGSMALVARFVYIDTRSRAAALIGAGTLAATYPLGQTALDLGRVDSLFLFVLLAGLYVTYAETRRFRPRWLGVAAGGALLGVAGLTKAPIAALPIAGAAALYLLLQRPRAIFPFVLGLIAILGGGLAVLRLQSGSWPSWYVWNLVQMHAPRDNLINRFWFSDILPRLTLPLLLGPLFAIARAMEGNWRALRFYLPVSVGLIGVAWASRTNIGASTNVLLPAHALIAILFGVNIHELLQQLQKVRPSLPGFEAYALGMCLVQFTLLLYNVRLTVPYRSDERADEALSARLAALPSPIFAPDLEGYTRTNALVEQPYYIAVGDLDAEYGPGPPTPEGTQWWSDLETALREHRFAAVVLRDEDCCRLASVVTANGYADAGELFPPGDEFWLEKTIHTPEEHLYLPAP